MVQIFDDGTAIQTNAAGQVTAYTDLSGTVHTPDRSILSEFASTVFGSLGRAIEQRLNPGQAAGFQPAATTGAASVTSSPVVMVALVVGAGFLVYKLLAK